MAYLECTYQCRIDRNMSPLLVSDYVCTGYTDRVLIHFLRIKALPKSFLYDAKLFDTISNSVINKSIWDLKIRRMVCFIFNRLTEVIQFDNLCIHISIFPITNFMDCLYWTKIYAIFSVSEFYKRKLLTWVNIEKSS